MDGEDTLRDLRPRYLERLRQRIALLEKMAGGDGAPEEMHRLAHSMASSAALYGYHRLSGAARKLEAQFAGDAPPGAALKHPLNDLIAAARDVVEMPTA